MAWMNKKNTPPNVQVEQGESSRDQLDFYHSPVQFRFDGWHRFAELVHRLKKQRAIGRDVDEKHQQARQLLEALRSIEQYTAYPSQDDMALLSELFKKQDYASLGRAVDRIVWALSTGRFRHHSLGIGIAADMDQEEFATRPNSREEQVGELPRPYFEVLIVDKNARDTISEIKQGFERVIRREDSFIYNVVAVPSFEDALIAALLNPTIQACVLRYDFPLRSRNHLRLLQRFLRSVNEVEYDAMSDTGHGPLLGSMMQELRPEIDLYLLSDESVEFIAGNVGKTFRRVFYQHDDYLELHLNLLRGIQERFETPFFNALRTYSRKPTGVFHAMPISRGKSVTKSNWIQDMLQFYGINIFLAETSATSGGLDSLLQPHGPIKKAQELAARAFGARRTYFVTNGTSTANKIVVQALVKPRDIILVDRDCHKSHHYGLVLSGAHVCYLDSYPLHQYSMYGAVPLHEIKSQLLAYRDAGRLDQVKMLLLTNCTFDGVVYNVERVMEECLAIKPDLVFLWDEAWFAFAAFTPTFRQRTAMSTARRLARRYRSTEFRARYDAQQQELGESPDQETLLKTRLLPDPDKVRIRAYATQSTHKSLTSLRQGSMIHIYDQDFSRMVEEPFDEAFMTHTSTSPNYQILASLDLGRRQVELEGFEMVQKQVELAMSIREQVARNPACSRHFRFLVAKDMVPPEFRPSNIEAYFDPESGWVNDNMEQAWEQDDFVVDPTRLTLYLGNTGIDGDTFKNKYLMDRHGIQINKTSRNTVLFMTNIGTTRSSVAFLIDVLTKIAGDLDQEQEEYSRSERRLFDNRVQSLTVDLPPLPDFSRFHAAFCPYVDGITREGDIRKAFFLAYDEDNYDYVPLGRGELERDIENGRELVSASFVIPYPPGFPILVPGQVISAEIVTFMRMLDVKEIHGFQADLGLQIFTEDALARASDSVT